MQTNVKWVVNWYRFRLKSHQINFHLSEWLRSFNTDFCGQAVRTAHHCITHKTNWMPKNWSSNRDVHQMSMSLKINFLSSVLFCSLSFHLIDRTTYVNYREWIERNVNNIQHNFEVRLCRWNECFCNFFRFVYLEIRTTDKEQLIGIANPSKNCQTKITEKKKNQSELKFFGKTHITHTHRIAPTNDLQLNEKWNVRLQFAICSIRIFNRYILRWNEMCACVCVCIKFQRKITFGNGNVQRREMRRAYEEH